MIETEMVEVLHVILEMICVLISRTFFQILLNMFFSKFSYQKLNLLLSEYFTGLQMKMIFLIYFQLISTKSTTKPMKFIFSETLISTYFKMENLSSKKTSHITLKISSSALANKYKEFCQAFSLTGTIKDPTRITCSTSTLLHHILTNSSEKVFQKGLIDVGISDHQLIYCTRKIKRIKHNMHNQIQVRSLKRYSAEVLTNALKTVKFTNYNTFRM